MHGHLKCCEERGKNVNVWILWQFAIGQCRKCACQCCASLNSGWKHHTNLLLPPQVAPLVMEIPLKWTDFGPNFSSYKWLSNNNCPLLGHHTSMFLKSWLSLVTTIYSATQNCWNKPQFHSLFFWPYSLKQFQTKKKSLIPLLPQSARTLTIHW